MERWVALVDFDQLGEAAAIGAEEQPRPSSKSNSAQNVTFVSLNAIRAALRDWLGVTTIWFRTDSELVLFASRADG